MSGQKNRIILGCMTFGPDETQGARITSLDDYKKHLSYFKGQGFDEIDTARSYVGGRQEAWTKDAGWKDYGFKIATKFYPSAQEGHDPETIEQKVTTSLKELGTDSVDIFYLHAADRNRAFPPALQAVDRLHKAGKFKTFALSNFTAAEVAEVQMTCKYNGWVRPTLYQGMYNTLQRGPEAELLPTLRRFGMDYVAYNPIAGGLLSGKIKSTDGAPEDGRFGSKSSTGANYRARYFRQPIFDALKHIEDAIAPHNLTMVETALRWMAHHSDLKTRDKGGNDGIIIGVSSFAQLESNLRDLEKGPLPEEVVKALDDASRIAKADCPNYWHGDLKYNYDTIEALFGQGAL